MANSRFFTLNVAAFVEKAKGNIDEVMRKVIIDVGTRIVERSPVGDPTLWKGKAPVGYVGGRFRANWQYGNRMGLGYPLTDLPDIDSSGQVSISRIVNGVPKVGAASTIHTLRNNLPYAYRLETGWSTQAPSGMVGVTVVEWTSIVEDAAQSVNPS